jgi:hypothetical protein
VIGRATQTLGVTPTAARCRRPATSQPASHRPPARSMAAIRRLPSRPKQAVRVPFRNGRLRPGLQPQVDLARGASTHRGLDVHWGRRLPLRITAVGSVVAREYEPTLGRFLTVDPVLDPNNPQQAPGRGAGRPAQQPVVLDPQHARRPAQRPARLLMCVGGQLEQSRFDRRVDPGRDQAGGQSQRDFPWCRCRLTACSVTVARSRSISARASSRPPCRTAQLL